MNVLEKEYSEKDGSYFTHNRDEMVAYVPEGVNYVLDVGCSSGIFGASLKKRTDCKVWGIEPDKGASEKAALVLDKVYNDIFTQAIDFGGQKFDCIVFNDVLEHLTSPFEALELCKRHLTTGGLLICSIPNIRFFDSMYHIVVEKDFHYVGAGIFDKTHLRFFTKKSVERMFQEAGYSIDKIEGINSIKYINKKGHRNFKILNTLFGNALADMEFQQFAVVAHH